MAKQKGIIKLKGTIGDITFYKTMDGHLARGKGGVDASRIKNDPNFQRTRENGSEFGRAGAAVKLLRTAFRTMLQTVADTRMVSRLTKGMITVIQADTTNIRGARTVLKGDLGLLEGFEFNINGMLGATLYAPYTAAIDRVSGQLTVQIPAFNPASLIAAPQGATHIKLVSAGAEIDFDAESFNVVTSDSGTQLISPNPLPVINLANAVTANSTKPLFLVLGIEFYQEVNGIMYPLKNGYYNALALVKVSKV